MMLMVFAIAAASVVVAAAVVAAAAIASLNLTCSMRQLHRWLTPETRRLMMSHAETASGPAHGGVKWWQICPSCLRPSHRCCRILHNLQSLEVSAGTSIKREQQKS